MNTPFDEKMLTEAWLKFTQTIPTEALLIKTMQLCLPHLLDSQTFEVAVENPDQIERLNQKAPDLLLFLKKQLKKLPHPDANTPKRAGRTEESIQPTGKV